MSKFTWVLLIVVIAVILATTGFLNSTGYFAFEPSQNCEKIQETYTDYIDNQVEECKTVEFTEYDCGDIPLEFATDMDDLDCTRDCINEIRVCTKYKDDGVTCYSDSFEYKCNNYRLSCKFGITNTDDTKGTWIVKWNRDCLPDQINCNSEPEDLGTYYYPLLPDQIKSSKKTVDFEVGAEINIYPEFVKIPTKNFCGDMEKTKEECKYVTVTEPIEKTRTVEICD